MTRRKIALDWSVGWAAGGGATPARRVPARVPGAVQLDWARAEGWPDYTVADNYKAYAWMEDVYWSYVATLDLPPMEEGEELYFVCGGVDYRFEVALDGTLLHAQEGMFTPFEIDLTGRGKSGDRVEILVFPVPKSHAEPVDRSQADECCKPAVSYGWDWHPRLIPLGIWEETYLEIRPGLHLRRAELSYELNSDCTAAELRVKVELKGKGEVRWTLTDSGGGKVAQQSCRAEGHARINDCLETPDLWWPNGQGRQPLYTSTVELLDSNGRIVDSRESRIGFRRVRLVMHPGQWDEPRLFPKSRSTPPITFEINGRAIFCKGSNWVNPEVFPGIITADTYRPLLTLAREAHMNLLRVWGGGIINKKPFYELCDELGLMVWQEFPLACNCYEGTPGYLEVLDRESRSIIGRLRQHACLALWCGGNELFNSWSRMTDQSLPLRLLNRNCFDMDPLTPFLPAAPVMGMGHGHYVFRDDAGLEVFQTMPAASNTAYTEFGCPGPSPANYLKRFIPPEEWFPPRPGTAWETHHAINAWTAKDGAWLPMKLIEEYFGPSSGLESLVARGEWLQCEGYKCIFEEARRQKPCCAIALNWCFNEPWPSAANNSIINWPAEPKPAYHAVASACRPSLASARIEKFRWEDGDLFSPGLWLLHDAPEPLPAGRLEALLKIGEREIFLLGWDFPEIPPVGNLQGPTLHFRLDRWETDRMILALRVKGRPDLDSDYELSYHAKSRETGVTTAVLNI